ncbi:MAG: hypothetical protein ACI9YH_001645, partial [Colwellia sp.]
YISANSVNYTITIVIIGYSHYCQKTLAEKIKRQIIAQ